jgi:small-conductance mechanosensitive channel
MEINAINNFWELINQRIENWAEDIIVSLPNLIVAVIIVICFGLISRHAGRLMGNVLQRVFESKQIASLLAAIFKVIVFVAGLFIALEFLGLTGTVTSLLAGAGIVGLAIGFAFQDMTENLIAGIAMGIRKPFQIGDVIEAEGVFGTVDSINLRNTLVETFYGQIEVIPNKLLFRNILTNYSIKGQRRLEIPVGISYADDVQNAREVLIEALNDLDFVINKDETNVFAKGFGSSSVDLLVWCWMQYPGDTNFMEARHQLVHTIHTTLAENDILIPFPIRTLDFDAKGGKALNDMLGSSLAKSSDE